MLSETSSEPTFEHLSKAAKIIGSENRTKKLLASYYLSRLQGLANAENVSLATPATNASCNKCSTPFSDNSNFSLSIKPRKVRRKKYLKLVTAYESNEKLSTSKAILARKYQKLVHNVAETTCTLCKSKQTSSVRFMVKNKSKSKTEAPSTPSIVHQLSNFEIVKPKKRKRDKYAGLKIVDKQVPSSISSTNLPIKPVIQPMRVIQKNSKPNNAKKKKGGGVVTKVKNVSSAEKQRKNILMLANVLKMNEQNQQNSSHMNLQKMFRK